MVASCFDDLDLGGKARFGKLSGYVMRLPKRELRAA